MYYTRWYYNLILKSIGQILYYTSFIFLIPLVFSIIFREPIVIPIIYLISFIVVFLFGLIWYKKNPCNDFIELQPIHYFIIVCGTWLLFTFVSTIPYYVFGYNFIDSFFDTMSLVTTTGTTTLPYLVAFKSWHLWRALLSWVGGIGIILIAFFGLLNSNKLLNSKKIAKAEGHDLMAGSYKDTIKDLWLIYLALTIIGIVLLLLVGVDFFNSVTYTMSSISTTGHSMPNENYLYQSNVQLVLAFIIFLASISFITHYKVFKEKKIWNYFKDLQVRSMTFMVLIVFIIFYLSLKNMHTWQEILGLLVGTLGGGFTSFSPEVLISLSPLLFILLIFLMFVGGGKGSTAGGITQERFLLLIKSITWQIREIRMPDLTNISKKFDGELIDDNLVKALYFFIVSYICFIGIGVLVLTIYNYPIATSIFEVVSTQGNIGIPIGIASHSLPLIPKIVLIINMWIGRLEIIPIFGLFGMLFQKLKL
ncbi:MAG: potassium transporter TrkG [archaeon]